MQSLTLTPIGFVRTPKCVKFQAGHQPRAADQDDNLLELQPGRDFEQALKDLAGFERIWLIWWFHRNPNWRPQVIPPRGPQRRRGVFATRSPHRPSPIGMTPVQLRGVEGLTLRLGACDLVDGTPVFDIKPYIPAYDSFPQSSAGWVDEVNLLETAPPAYKVRLLPLAVEQVRWLAEGWGIEFIQQAEEVLVRDPSVHRTRRISRRAGGLRVLACGAWRVVFDVLENVVSIVSVEPGYPMTFLVREGYEEIPQREALIAFYSRWPDCPLAEVKE